MKLRLNLEIFTKKMYLNIYFNNQIDIAKNHPGMIKNYFLNFELGSIQFFYLLDPSKKAELDKI